MKYVSTTTTEQVGLVSARVSLLHWQVASVHTPHTPHTTCSYVSQIVCVRLTAAMAGSPNIFYESSY